MEPKGPLLCSQEPSIGLTLSHFNTVHNLTPLLQHPLQ